MSFTLSDQKETIIALATPQGVGAIAVIRLSGPEAIRLTNKVFWEKPGKAGIAYYSFWNYSRW